MSFTRKALKDNKRRSFQINIGLREGYDSKVVHNEDKVIDLIGRWMFMKMTESSRCLTGGVLLSGPMIYAWNSSPTGVKVNIEDTILFVGEVNPLYSADLHDSEVISLLEDLASFLGEELNQTRMYIMYMDQIIILQNDNIDHPTKT